MKYRGFEIQQVQVAADDVEYMVDGEMFEGITNVELSIDERIDTNDDTDYSDCYYPE